MDVGCFRVLRDGKYDLDFKILDDANRFIMLDCLVDLYKLSYGSIQWCPLKAPLTRMTGKSGRSPQLVQASRCLRMLSTMAINPKQTAKAIGDKFILSPAQSEQDWLSFSLCRSARWLNTKVGALWCSIALGRDPPGGEHIKRWTYWCAPCQYKHQANEIKFSKLRLGMQAKFAIRSLRTPLAKKPRAGNLWNPQSPLAA